MSQETQGVVIAPSCSPMYEQRTLCRLVSLLSGHCTLESMFGNAIGFSTPFLTTVQYESHRVALARASPWSLYCLFVPAPNWMMWSSDMLDDDARLSRCQILRCIIRPREGIERTLQVLYQAFMSPMTHRRFRQVADTLKRGLQCPQTRLFDNFTDHSSSMHANGRTMLPLLQSHAF